MLPLSVTQMVRQQAGEAEGMITFNNQDGQNEEQQSLNHMRSEEATKFVIPKTITQRYNNQ